MTAPAPLSPDSTAILRWCEADAHPCSFSPLLAIDWDWHAVSAALGLGDCHHNSHWPRIHAAFDELHAAGRLAYFDHGPNTYGHTSTMLVPAPAAAPSHALTQEG